MTTSISGDFVVVVLAAWCVAGCGAGSQIPSNRGGAAATGPAQLCKRAAELRDAHCSPFDRVDDALIANCSIVDGIYIAAIQDCMQAPACSDVQKCATAVREHGGVYRGPTRPCAEKDSTIPVGVTAAELEASYGRRDTKFSDSRSSALKPIEVCGMPAQLEYLTRLACDDGSKPFPSRSAAEHARVGNVGAGGRCNRVVDEYRVTCPEQDYSVYIDPYRCLAQP